MLFGIPHYTQCLLHGHTSVLLCVSSSLLTAQAKGVDLAVACDAFPSKQKPSILFIAATLIAEVLFEQFLIHNVV